MRGEEEKPSESQREKEFCCEFTSRDVFGTRCYVMQLFMSWGEKSKWVNSKTCKYPSFVKRRGRKPPKGFSLIVLVSREANAKPAAGGKEHMMRSKLAVNVWEEGRSINRDTHEQIPALHIHVQISVYSQHQTSKGYLRKNGVKKIAESILMPAHKSALWSCLGKHFRFQSIHLKKIQQE